MRHLTAILTYFGLLTITLARLSALVEVDLKKTVALRTLSQVGFIIVTLGLGLPFFTLVHLISHALFKRCLFIQVGYIIHTKYNRQDVRGYLNFGGVHLLSKIQIVLCLMCLCGFTFTRGYLSKHLILRRPLSSHYQFTLICIIIFIVFITWLYSLRLVKALLGGGSSPIEYSIRSITFIFIRLILCTLRVAFLSWVNINIRCCPTFVLVRESYITLLFLCLIFVILLLTTKTNVLYFTKRPLYELSYTELLSRTRQRFIFNP